MLKKLLEENSVLESFYKLSYELKKEFIKKILSFDKKKLDKKEIKKKSILDKAKPFLDVKTYSKKYEKLGKEAVEKGEVLLVILAAGMGSRLGYSGAKGCVEIKGKPLFYYLLKNVNRKNRVAIMTSLQNYEEVRGCFFKNNFFGFDKKNIIFFTQDDLPLKDDKGWFLENGRLVSAPDGNGGFFTSFSKIEKDIDENIKYIQIIPVDNILAPVLDPVFIGSLIESDKEISILAIERKEDEKMGVLAFGSRVFVIEYLYVNNPMN